jgi:signal transduction histidine kinase
MKSSNKGDFSILVKTEFLPYPDSNENDKVGKGIVKLSILDAGTGFAPRILSRAFEAQFIVPRSGDF